MDKGAELDFNISATSTQNITSTIRFSTQDIGTAKLIFNLFKDGVSLPLNAVEGTLVMGMADGSKFVKTVNIVDKLNGVIEYTLSEEELQHYGRVIAELYLKYDNDQRMTVHRFSFNIDKALIDADILPTAEYYVSDFESLRQVIEALVAEIEENLGDLNKINAQLATFELNKADKDTVEKMIEEVAKRGYVSFSQFGAPLTGKLEDDDTPYIKAAYEFANEHGYPVREPNGKIRLMDTVEVKVPSDLGGCELIIDNNTPNTALIKVEAETDYQEVPLNTANIIQSQFYEGATVIPSLAAYKYCFIKITNDEILGYRNGTTAYYKQEYLVHYSDGAIVGGPLMTDFTTGNIKIEIKPIIGNGNIEFISPTIDYERTDPSYVPFAIMIKRHGTRLKNVNLNVTGLTEFNSDKYVGSLINIHDCFDIEVDTVNGENLSAYSTTKTQPAYILALDNLVRVRLKNLNAIRGWGIMGTHFIKIMSVEDSYINRLDNHIGCGNLHIKNCVFYGEWGCYLGWGKGKVTLESCTTEYVEGLSSIKSKSAVTLRTDWGLIFEGQIDIKYHTIKNHTENVGKLSIVNLWNTFDYNYQAFKSSKLPEINISQLTIDNEISCKVVGFYLKLGVAFKNVRLGSLDISGVNVINETEKNYFNAIEHNPEVKTFADGEQFFINLSNIGKGVPKKYIEGFINDDFATTETRYNVTRLAKELIYIYDSQHSNVYVVELKNCKGNVVIHAKNKSSIFDSVVSCLDLFSTNALDTKISNSLLYPFSSDTGFSTVLNLNKAEIQNCTINCIKRDGAFQPLSFENESNCKLLLNNVMKGVNDSAKVNKLLKYISSDYNQA